MPNMQELEQYEAFWDLPGHKKPALLIIEMIVEYEAFLGAVRPRVADLLRVFRGAGLPIFWSTWLRPSPQLLERMGLPASWSRNHSNELDRFYGPQGVDSGENGNFLYKDRGWETLPDLAPLTEVEKRRVQRTWRLDCFAESGWEIDAGQGSLAAELRSLGVDVVVTTGVWTDACVVATAFGGMNEDFDMVVVEDAVDTVTTGHQAALLTIRGAAGKICDTAKVIDYVAKGFGANHSGHVATAVNLSPKSVNVEETRTSRAFPVDGLPYPAMFFVAWTLLAFLAGYTYAAHATPVRWQAERAVPEA